MAPGGRRLNARPTINSECPPATIAGTDAPGKRGKACCLTLKKYRKLTNNHRPRVKFRVGMLKPVGNWSKEFTCEVARICRVNAPLMCRQWKKVDQTKKDALHARILEKFDIDLHHPHVKRAVDRFLGQRLRDFRCKLHKFYEQIPEGEDKRQNPHEDVSQENWLIVCSWFESEDYKKLSEQNKLARRKLKVNHCCGSKPFVRYREEQRDKDTQQELGRIDLYRGTHFSEKKGRWVAPEAEEIYEAMNSLHSRPTPEDSTPMTEDQVVDTILGVRPGYVRGLGHGEDPMSTLPPSSLDPQIVEDLRRSTQDAERRARDADRRAQEAERRLEETEK